MEKVLISTQKTVEKGVPIKRVRNDDADTFAQVLFVCTASVYIQ